MGRLYKNTNCYGSWDHDHIKPKEVGTFGFSFAAGRCRFGVVAVDVGASTTRSGSGLDVLAFNRQGEGFGVVLDGNSAIRMPDGLRQTVEIGLQELWLARESR